MRIFVTGSTGFIGSHFLRTALAAGHEVIALRYPGTSPVIPIPESDRLTWIDGDLNSFLTDLSESQNFSISASSSAEPAEQLAPRHSPLASSPSDLPLHSPSAIIHSPLAESPSALVHLAAAGVNPKHAGWDLCFDVNVHQSLELWRRAAAMGIKHFVICGSCFEYGLSAETYEFIPTTAPLMPTGAYHASKAAATMAAIALAVEGKLDLAVLRPFHVFGEGEGPDRFWPSLRKAALAGEDFPMSPGEQIRDFIPVEQVAEALLRELGSGELQVSRNESKPATRDPLPVTSSSTSPATRHRLPDTAFRIRIANVGTGRPQTILEFARYWWNEWGATGKLLPGALPYRPNEVMRYVPKVSPLFSNCE